MKGKAKQNEESQPEERKVTLGLRKATHHQLVSSLSSHVQTEGRFGRLKDKEKECLNPVVLKDVFANL